MTHYLITGGTGYIGSMIIMELLKKADIEKNKVEITAIVRDKEWAEQILPQGVNFVEADITDGVAMNMVEGSFDYIIHCAAVTTSAYMVSNPVETADGIVLGTRNVLEQAKRQKVKGMVYLSSMEVYGRVADINRPRKEEELGDVTLDSPRSCYSLGKRMAEHYCYIFFKEYGVPVKIARLAQTFGRGVRKSDERVYMQFARSVMEKKDIVLRTEGKTIGNYCGIEDALTGIFLILEHGNSGQTYNVVNEENTMSVRDMAELVAKEVGEGRINVSVQSMDLQASGYAPDTELYLSGEKLRGLGWKPKKGLVDMYRDIIFELQSMN